MKKLEEQAKTAWNGVSFSPEKRGESFIKEAKRNLSELKEELGEYYNEEKLISLYSDVLSVQSRCLSPMITGPANFPVARNEKTHNFLHKKWENLEEYIERVRKAKRKNEKKQATAEAGGELQQARTQLAEAEAGHKQALVFNKIIRKKGTYEEKKQIMLDANIPIWAIEDNHEFAQRHYNKDFDSLYTVNSNARIKRLKQKVTDIESRENAESKEYTGILQDAEYKIIQNIEADRLQIICDGKPEEEIRTIFKKNGMRWSPKNQAWQRKLTQNAIWAIQRVFENIKKVG